MSLYRVIQKPLVTEKTSTLEVAGERSVYTVKVAPESTKVSIKQAFKAAYGVDAQDVRIVSMREKFRNTRKGVALKRRPFKKAYVTLKAGQTVDFSKVK